MPDPIVAPTTETTSAREHLNWCIERAMVYYDMNEPAPAIASFLSDVGKHDRTAWIQRHPLSMMELMNGANGTREEFCRAMSGFAVTD